jgi:GNAT superfamily N-acetyltransferase
MSGDTSNLISFSDIDTQRFGIRIGRALLRSKDSALIALDFCRDEEIEMLIARCNASELEVVHSMESHGFQLMDTLVYWKRDLLGKPLPLLDDSIEIRPARVGEESAVSRVAADCFQGYLGHYHADPRLPRQECDAIYIDWAVNSCISREIADEVLVAELDRELVGFVTVRLNNPEEAEAVLNGVATRAQRKGVYASAIRHAMHWAVKNNAASMIVSTQITNIAVQKVWTRLGFEPQKFWYTFHWWRSTRQKRWKYD